MVLLIIAMVVGVLAGGLTVGIVEAIGHKIFPPPPGLNVDNPDFARIVMDQIPLGAKLAVIVAWGLGVMVGGTVAALIARRGPMPAWWVGAILFGMAAWSMMMFPHPPWMWIAAIVTTIIASYGAGLLGGRKSAAAAQQSPQ